MGGLEGPHKTPARGDAPAEPGRPSNLLLGSGGLEGLAYPGRVAPTAPTWKCGNRARKLGISGSIRTSTNPAASIAPCHSSGARKPPFGRYGGRGLHSPRDSLRFNINTDLKARPPPVTSISQTTTRPPPATHPQSA